jgi:hypothetical protein
LIHSFSPHYKAKPHDASRRQCGLYLFSSLSTPYRIESHPLPISKKITGVFYTTPSCTLQTNSNLLLPAPAFFPPSSTVTDRTMYSPRSGKRSLGKPYKKYYDIKHRFDFIPFCEIPSMLFPFMAESERFGNVQLKVFY